MTPSNIEGRFWDQLLQFIEEERVLPIIGPDLLRIRIDDRDTLLYPYVAAQLARYLDIDATELPDGGELNAVACRYVAGPDNGDLQDVYAGLKKVMSGLGDIAPPAALIKLAEIRPLKLFVSTTFDSLMAHALDQVRAGTDGPTRTLSFSPHSAEDLPCEISRLDRPTVYHIFGSVSAVPSYAVTEEDTLEFVHALQLKARGPEMLFDELSRHQLLIIGSRLPSWLARFFLRTTTGERLSLARAKTFVADQAVREDNGLLQFLKSFSSRTTVYNDGTALDFVDEMHRRWVEHSSGRAPTESPSLPKVDPLHSMTSGSIFISYASEDRAEVLQIGRELDQAGLDAWLDASTLEAGDAFEGRIKDAIERCAVFMPIISRHALTHQRRFFRIEWRHAQEVAKRAVEGEAFILPVVIDDTSPVEKAIPAAFRELHWERLESGGLAPEFMYRLQRLVRHYSRIHHGES